MTDSAPQARVLQQVLERTAGRLFELQAGIHARRIEAHRKLVVAIAISAARHDGGVRVLERYQMRAALDPQRGRRSGELLTKRKRTDRQLMDIDAGQARAALLSGLAHGLALDFESHQPQTSDVHVPCQERERRPAQRDAVRGEPDATLIAELQLLEFDGRRKGTGEAREPHMAVR